MPAKGNHDILIIGAGLIGLSVAWRAAQRGARVTVLEAGTAGGGASHVAAGMLAPVTEAEVGEAGRRLLELSLASLDRWPAFAAELREATGIDVGLRRTGALVLARDADEAEAIERELAFRRELELDVERLRPSEARRREPALAPTVRLALDIAGDHSIDPRRLVAALADACEHAGAQLRRARVQAVERGGVTLADGSRVAAERVVVAAGAHVGRLEGA